MRMHAGCDRTKVKKTLLRETLQKCLYRHAGENRHPVINVPPSYLPPGRGKGIPAFAGMTNWKYSGLIQSFLKVCVLVALCEDTLTFMQGSTI
jgi:hypothetical protein